MKLFKCPSCGNDEIKFSIFERLFYETNPSKTLPDYITLDIFSNKTIASSFVATCNNCGTYWKSKFLADLKKVMEEEGVLT